jgi:hypothetical protein
MTSKEQLVLTAVWRNGGFSASYDSFVVDSSAVLRLNFCAKIRHYAKPRNVCDLNQLLMKQVIECYLTDGRN